MTLEQYFFHKMNRIPIGVAIYMRKNHESIGEIGYQKMANVSILPEIFTGNMPLPAINAAY